MINKLAKSIVEQFIDIVDKASVRCGICWDKCSIKIVSRQYIDSLVIEVYQKRSKVSSDDFSPLPLVVIDYTNIKRCDLSKKSWISYLQKQAAILLTKLSASNDGLNAVVCCPPKKQEAVPKNCCDQSYYEEFSLCCRDTPPCQDEPYHRWGKDCKKKSKCNHCNTNQCCTICPSLGSEIYDDNCLDNSLTA